MVPTATSCASSAFAAVTSIVANVGRDQRGRVTVADLVSINGAAPEEAQRRPDFGSLIASYPERKLKLETGKPAKGGPELTRRAIDLIAPIGYGQRALIVAPARAGKTMLLQAIDRRRLQSIIPTAASPRSAR